MARVSFRLPDIGEGIAEAEIVAWHVAVGDMIEEDAALADMMTDKATVEMTAPVSGRVVELAGAVGDSIAIGSTLAVFEAEGEGEHSPEPDTATAARETPSPAPSVPSPSTPPAASLRTGEVEAPSPIPADPSTSLGANGRVGKVTASPAVRQRAKDLGVDLSQVQAAGGHVRHADLDAFLLYNRGFAPAATTRGDEQIKVLGLRRRIAENMAAAKRHIPHFTYVEEVEVTRAEELRAEMNAGRGDVPRLTILPFLVTAIARALPLYPMLNARYDDEAGVVTRFGALHLGLATQTDAGLMVPVIRNAHALNLWQIAGEIRRLAEAARGGQARSEELSGSTFTLTSLGPLAGIVSTPIVNRPEVAILGPGRVIERPVVREGQIVVGKVMNLSISCDHRVVDGHDAASFVAEVKRLLEKPALLFAPVS